MFSCSPLHSKLKFNIDIHCDESNVVSDVTTVGTALCLIPRYSEFRVLRIVIGREFRAV